MACNCKPRVIRAGFNPVLQPSAAKPAQPGDEDLRKAQAGGRREGRRNLAVSQGGDGTETGGRQKKKNLGGEPRTPSGTKKLPGQGLELPAKKNRQKLGGRTGAGKKGRRTPKKRLSGPGANWSFSFILALKGAGGTAGFGDPMGSACAQTNSYLAGTFMVRKRRAKSRGVPRPPWAAGATGTLARGGPSRPPAGPSGPGPRLPFRTKVGEGYCKTSWVRECGRKGRNGVLGKTMGGRGTAPSAPAGPVPSRGGGGGGGTRGGPFGPAKGVLRAEG